jgi:acyl-CoA synthetase (AMP-forming)/AMP-acid ligase II
MNGYHNRPDATAEAIWMASDGRTYLNSGDIGKLDDDGFLYTLDRKKDMILADVTVIGIPDPRWDEAPLALIIPRPGASPNLEAIKQWINERIGKHQRVAGVRLRESFPRNAVGKVLKKELRAEYGS